MNPQRLDFKQLRQVFDGNDQFMQGVSVRGSPRSGNAARAATAQVKDSWAFDDERVRLLLMRVFPKKWEKQHKRAALWMKIINEYFRMGLTANRIAFELKRKPKYIENVVRRIRRAAAGVRTDGKPRTGKPRGRPKKLSPALSRD